MVSRTWFIITYLVLRKVVRSGFLDTYRTELLSSISDCLTTVDSANFRVKIAFSKLGGSGVRRFKNKSWRRTAHGVPPVDYIIWVIWVLYVWELTPSVLALAIFCSPRMKTFCRKKSGLAPPRLGRDGARSNRQVSRCERLVLSANGAGVGLERVVVGKPAVHSNRRRSVKPREERQLLQMISESVRARNRREVCACEWITYF